MAVPDYELDDQVVAGTPQQLKALADPLRTQILDLVLERAATVTELAEAVGRPRGTVAYHVDLLVGTGLVKVVRTRKVRAIEERFYGRVGRTIVIGDGPLPEGVTKDRFLVEAAAEARGDLSRRGVLSTLRHARIPEADAEAFFARLVALAEEFTALPRGGETVFGLIAAVYPTGHPTLPELELSDE